MSGSLAMWQSGPAVRPALLELRLECVTVRMNVEKHFLHIHINGPAVWRIAVSADFGLVLQDRHQCVAEQQKTTIRHSSRDE